MFSFKFQPLSVPTITIHTKRFWGDSASWYCAMVLLAMILLGSIRESTMAEEEGEPIKGNNLRQRPCDEIYVVGEGETLHTISDMCNDPFIVERNPHIHDPDDVFPGLVIKIIPIHQY
ncbi:hypothetical protein JHK82_029065 [Glycine max]|nr:hypothetical protein JHK85_029721 [Glycine max]KAG5128230.1 hypothetical protein JHK82_029065 [Glycine max]